MSQYSINLSDIVPIYQEVIDDLIEKLGKDVNLYTKKKIIESPANYDQINNEKRLPEYKTGVIKPEYEIETIRCIIKWFKRLTLSADGVERQTSQFRIKTHLINAPKIERADFIIPHVDAIKHVNTRYKIVSDPQIIGLGEDRYVIYYCDPINV